LKIRKKPIYVDFSSYIFTFITCKPGLKLNLDIDPDPTKAKFLDPDPDPQLSSDRRYKISDVEISMEKGVQNSGLIGYSTQHG
jgi:hypothetical protein